MTFTGHIHDGKLVFDTPLPLPDGTAVRGELTPTPPPGVTSGTRDLNALRKAAEFLRNSTYDWDAIQKQDAIDIAHAEDHLK